MARKSKSKKTARDKIWEIPDPLWESLESILEELYRDKPTGRPRVDLRRVLDAIFYRMRTGCQWNKLPERFGSDSTVHRWFQRFCRDGVFERLWTMLANARDDLAGADWEWQSADGRMGKARFGGKNPTDRGKPGTETSLVVEARGGPLGVVIAGANVHDCKLLEATIEAIVVDRPEPTAAAPRHLCSASTRDTTIRRVARRRPRAATPPHIRRIGEEKRACAGRREPPRRWVVERTFAWLCKCRADAAGRTMAAWTRHALGSSRPGVNCRRE